MADPLSVTASVLTLLSASTACVQTLQSAIRDWRKAPDEIAQLNNEVVEIQGLLDTLHQNLRKDAQASSVVTVATERKLNALKVALADLEELMKSFHGISRGRLKYKWLREKAHVSRIQKTLLRARCGLQEILTVNTL